MSSISPITELDILILSYITPQDVYNLNNTTLYNLKLDTSTSQLSKLYQFIITSDIERLNSHFPNLPPTIKIHKNLIQTAIKHSSSSTLQYLIKHSTEQNLHSNTDTICEHLVTATHSNKPHHLLQILNIFNTTFQIYNMYYSRHVLYINFDYCFNYAYQKNQWQIVNILVNNEHVNAMLKYINPKFKNLLYKFHTEQMIKDKKQIL